MEIDLTCVNRKFELASWKFGLTLCEPDWTIREFKLISLEFDLTIYELYKHKFDLTTDEFELAMV